MSLIDDDTGLAGSTGLGLIWLLGGLGGPGLWNGGDVPPDNGITTDLGVVIVTDAGIEITTG